MAALRHSLLLTHQATWRRAGPGPASLPFHLERHRTVLDKHVPLDAAADVINDLRLNSTQIRRVTAAVQRIVATAYERLPAARRPHDFAAFTDSVPAHHWALMFEACALRQLGRNTEACALITAARHLDAVHHCPKTAPA